MNEISHYGEHPVESRRYLRKSKNPQLPTALETAARQFPGKPTLGRQETEHQTSSVRAMVKTPEIVMSMSHEENR